MSPSEAFRTLKAGEVGQVVPRYQVGPFDLFSNPDVVDLGLDTRNLDQYKVVTDTETGDILGTEKDPFYKAKIKASKVETAIKKALGAGARLLGPLNIPAAGLAASQ